MSVRWAVAWLKACPHARVAYFFDQYRHLRAVLGENRDVLCNDWSKYYLTDHVLRTPERGFIHFMTPDPYKYQGYQFDRIYFDECRELEYPMKAWLHLQAVKGADVIDLGSNLCTGSAGTAYNVHTMETSSVAGDHMHKFEEFLMSSYSCSDTYGGPVRLPEAWIRHSPEQRRDVVRYLNSPHRYERPSAWRTFAKSERTLVVRHLRHAYHVCSMNTNRPWPKYGLYPADRLARHIQFKTYVECPESYIDRQVRDTLEKKADTQAKIYGDGTYVKKAAGERILHHSYTKLTTNWRRASGQEIRPRDMSIGHLECTITLIEESWNNLHKRAGHQLGGVFKHIVDPTTREALWAAGQCVDNLTIEQVYPIYKVLMSELGWRRRRARISDDHEWGPL